MFENYQCRGFLSVLGAFMIAMAIGLMYLWGIIAIYATSYFRIVMNNLKLNEQATNIVFPLLLLGQAISIPIAGRMYKRTSPRLVCVICGVALSAVIYLSSYAQSFSTFVWLFGIAPGIIIGFLYIYPTAHCYKYFPTKKTLISGLIISASGIGTLFFALMAHDTINHSNESISLEFGYYGSEIALKFPSYLRNLSTFLFIFVTGGGLLLFELPSDFQNIKKNENIPENKVQLLNREFDLHQDQEEEEQVNPFGNMSYEMVYINKGFENSRKKIQAESQREIWKSINERESDFMVESKKEDIHQEITPNSPQKSPTDNINECPRVRDAPRQFIFWVLFSCILLSANFGLMISCNYKTYVKYKMDDEYLTFVGAFGALLCGISRFLWTQLMLKFSFRYLLWLLLIINSFLAFTIYYISSVPFIYLIYVLASWVIYGGLLGMFPALTSNIFGSRYSPQIYGFLFYGFPLSNFIQFLLIQWIEFEYGYWFVFMISAGMSVGGLLISNKITGGQYNWSHRIRENNERKRLLAR